MQTRPAKRNGRVAREHRGKQKMSNDLRHHNIVRCETNPEIITVNEFVVFVNTQVFENSLSAVGEERTMWPTWQYNLGLASASNAGRPSSVLTFDATIRFESGHRVEEARAMRKCVSQAQLGEESWRPSREQWCF
jgi:hypothetical protein